MNDSTVKIEISGNDGFLVSNPIEFNNLAKKSVSIFDSQLIIYLFFLLPLILIINLNLLLHLKYFYKLLSSCMFAIFITVLAFYQSGLNYFLLKILFIFAMQSSFMFILFRYNIRKNTMPILGIFILIIFANIPLLTQGFLYTDDIWGFMSSGIHNAVGMRRPLFFITGDYGILLNHDTFYLFRLLTISFFILFSVSLYLYLQNSFTRKLSFVTTVIITCSVITSDIIGYASVFPVTQSLFLSIGSFIIFEYSLKQHNILRRAGLYIISSIVLLAAFCFYQISTPIVFTLIAVAIIRKSLSLKNIIKYLVIYGLTSIIYLVFTKSVAKLYSMPLGQNARGEFINSISDIIGKILFFTKDVIPQVIYKFISIFTGNSIFVSDNLFYTNYLKNSFLQQTIIIVAIVVMIVGMVNFYRTNKSLKDLLLLALLIPLSYYPFLILKNGDVLTYYIFPITCLITIYFVLIIATIVSKLRISLSNSNILIVILLSLVVMQSNYYSGKVWVTKNVLWYNELRNNLCAQKTLDIKGGSIQVYGRISPTMTEPYIEAAVKRVLSDCGYDYTKFNIRVAVNEFTILYMSIGQYNRLISNFTADEKEYFKDIYHFSREYSHYYLVKNDFTDDDKKILSSALKKADIIFDNATTVINILPSHYR